MAALYVTSITRSVLTGSTYFSLVFSYLLVIACLYVALYFVNVSRYSLDNFLRSLAQMVTGSLSMIGLSQRAHLSIDHFLAELGLSRRFMI